MNHQSATGCQEAKHARSSPRVGAKALPYPKLLVATRNPGKMREYHMLLRDLLFELVSLDDIGVNEDVEETGETFHENASLKALNYASLAGETMMALADDSGLEVDALGGEPGVRSARYGEELPNNAPSNQPSAPLLQKGVGVISSNPQPTGQPMSDQDRVTLLLKNLIGVPWEKRTASFRCVVCISKPSAEGGIEIAASVEGTIAGMIQYRPMGEDGFGYDPVFYLPSYGVTIAQIPPEEKNRISHRATATSKAMAVLQKLSNSG